MYEQFFGLDEEPFRLTPDPRYLYLSAKHAEALAHLRLGLTESSGFVCITGEVGTGKTTLLRAFLAELGPNVAAAYAFVPPLSVLDLLRRICREFGVTPASDTQSDMLDALQAYLVAEQAAGRTCVVILDEAQALSIELLEQVRLLLNFETETEKLLRIVLVGQPQLRNLLMHPDLAQLNQRITLRWHLGALSYRQTVAYVQHRLGVASRGRVKRLLTVPALRMLHRVSGGVPRLINMVTHRALLTAFVEKQERVQRRSVAHAYREIQAVPLPGRMWWPAYRTSAAVAGLAASLALIAIGGPRLGGMLAASTPPPVAPAVAVPEPVAEADSGVQAPVAAADPVAPAQVAVALATTSTTPPFVTDAELERGLRDLDPDRSARGSIESLLAAWGVGALGETEAGSVDDLEAVAWRRGLQSLVLTGNRSMLQLLDLPALLTVRIRGYEVPRFVTLVGGDGAELVLEIDGRKVRLTGAQLDRLWSGQARLLWRDTGGLGPVLGVGTRGLAVMRLQDLLRQAGAMADEPTGVFDAATEHAVIAFQREHQLEPDGRVGPFTRIVLYGLGGGYERPTLGGGSAS